MINKRLCVGLLTHCDSNQSPERFEILKTSVNSLQNLNKDKTYIYVWDNNSSTDVREFLKSKDFFDACYFSKKNLYDLAAVHKLVQESKKVNAEYVCHLEDDFYFYKDDFIDPCLEFMDQNHDCGYLRILKYEYNRKELYDKFLKHPQVDAANCQRHFNQITKKPLTWELPKHINNYKFYKNNWHWYNYANICRAKVFEGIIPNFDYQPLQPLEGYMMEKYNELNLKVGVLDIGVVTHLGQFNEKMSQRVNLVSKQKKMPTIKYEEVVREINNCELCKP